LGDTDADGICDEIDNCVGTYNPDQADGDGDTVGDACDVCNGFDDLVDTDGDGVPDGCDVCSGFDDSIDTDGDGVPDGCDDPLTINEPNFTDLSIQPNPFEHTITINIPIGYLSNHFNISFFDLNGRLVLTETKEDNKGIIIVNNLDQLEAGVYFIKILVLNGKEGEIIRRLIKY